MYAPTEPNVNVPKKPHWKPLQGGRVTEPIPHRMNVGGLPEPAVAIPVIPADPLNDEPSMSALFKAIVY